MATEVGTSVGAVVDVIVSPVVISDVVTGPGGGGSSWAALMPFDATAKAPMASTAPAPTVAAPVFSCFEFTL
jgi:hypothetical protein